MPEQPQQPTIIVQNTNQQNNDGCGTNGCGMGCLVIVLASILLFPLGMMSSAMEGEAPGYWIPLGIILTLIEILIIGALAFVWLDKKFGWGYTSNDGGPAPNTVKPEDLVGDASNYGVSRPESKEDFQKRMDQHREAQKTKPQPPRSKGVNQSVNLPRAKQPDVTERLRRLKTLLDEGHLTQEEYEAKKAELLKLL